MRDIERRPSPEVQMMKDKISTSTRTNNRIFSCICSIFVQPDLHSAPLFSEMRERSIYGDIQGALIKTANADKCQVVMAAKSPDLKALQTLPVICDLFTLLRIYKTSRDQTAYETLC